MMNFEEVAQRVEAMRQQVQAMDDMERDENGMTKEGAFEFNGQVQALFVALDTFEDAMVQAKKV